MDAERHRALSDAFGAWLDLDAAGRAAFLETLRADHGEVAADVEALIEAEASAGDFLEAPVAETSPDAMIGLRLGSYRLISELGRGGMGAVYLAQRADEQFVQHVAIKVIRAGLDARAAAAFRRERQILAGLSHAFIAHLIDGGDTANGDPYLVMEFVEGRPINRHCEEHGLPGPARLRLFLKVCEAVQFAHQHLVVHRDIKPANILVTRDGVPKLLDFGIARMMQAADSLEPLSRTAPLLTPEYASPEQVSGQPMTTATDVYSLGVVLYEMLVGVRPYQQVHDTSGVYAMLDAIRHEEPKSPTKAAAARAGAPRLDRDLDAIVLKALRKDPAERYGSVEQFIDDLRRHLEGRPIRARHASRLHRGRKFVARHRASVAATTVVVLSLVAATVVSHRQAAIAQSERRRAERRFNDVRQLANAFVFEFDQSLQTLPGATAARRLAISRGLEYLERLAGDAGSAADAPLLRELASGYQRIAQVQGNPYVPNLGDGAAAATSSRRAVELFGRLLTLPAATDADSARYASSIQDQGDLLWVTGDFHGALDRYRLALALNRTLLGGRAHETEPDRVHAVARSEYAVGQACTKLGRFSEALQSYERARDAYQEIPHALETRGELRRLAAAATMKIGDGLSRRGDHEVARQQFERALGLIDPVDTTGAAGSTTARTRAFLLNRLSVEYAELGDPRRAQQLGQQALDIIEGLARADAGDRQARGDLGIFRSSLGMTAFRAGRPAAAEILLKSALEEFETLERAGPVAVDQRSEHGVAYQRAADVARASGRAAEARTQYQAAFSRLDPAPRDMEYQADIALVMMRLGQMSSGADAKAWLTGSLAAWKDAEARGVRPGALRPGGVAYLQSLLKDGYSPPPSAISSQSSSSSIR